MPTKSKRKRRTILETYNLHIDLVKHKDENLWECDKCNTQFGSGVSATYLDVHMIMHSLMGDYGYTLDPENWRGK